MGWIIFWCILALLMIILLIPLRIPFSVEGKKWSVSVYYGFFRILQLPKPEEETPADNPVSTETPTSPKTEEQASQPKEETAFPQKDEKPPVSEENSVPPIEDTATEQSDWQPIPEDDILPEDISTPEPPPEKAKKPKKKSFFERLKPSGFSDIMALVKDVLASISAPLRLLTRHLHFIKMKVNVSIASDDAAKTAITYGTVSSSAFWLLGQLQCIFDVQAEKFSIRSDFLGTKSSFSIQGELRSTPISLLTVVLGAGIRFLVRSWLRFRREDKEQKAIEKASEALTQTSAQYQ